MQSVIIEYVLLIMIIIGLVMISDKLKISFPIVLVIGGLMLSVVPVFGDITIDPELIFFIFLPPLLYEAAWQVSWKEFWKWRRIIMSFAFPIVILTSCVVAFSSTLLIPGFTLALGFLLGGIVSPPDAISATTIMRQVGAPKVLVSVAEGESLLNDASALIVFRFALIAVLTGTFHLSTAVSNFFLVVAAGIAVGLLIGLFFYAVYRWLPTTASIEIVLSFLAPYCMYYVAELFHFSGVLAVVSGGLLLSSKRNVILSYSGRVQGSNVWSTIGFVLNGLVFMLIGLQLPSILRGVEEVSAARAISYGLIISVVLIVVRIGCTIGAALFTKFMSHFITVADSNPGWRVPVVFGWAGMRGVVSLAAALSIPVMVDGHPFPYRNLILIITFVVIIITLVVQGLTLPWIMRLLKVHDDGFAHRQHTQELAIRGSLAKTATEFLRSHEKGKDNQHIRNLLTTFETEIETFGGDADRFEGGNRAAVVEYQNLYLELLERQRDELQRLNGGSEYEEEVIRKYLSLIDLEETKMREMAMKPSNEEVSGP